MDTSKEKSAKTSCLFNGELRKPRWFYRQWMLAGNPPYFFDRLTKDFGDFFYYRGLFRFYFVNHPALVKQVLQETHKNFDKRNIIYRRLGFAFGDGLVVADGERWKRSRKMMQPMFGPITVRKFFGQMQTATQEMLQSWEARHLNGPSFNLADEMERITLEIAGRILFSDGFTDAADRIGAWTKHINRYCAKPPLPIIREFWFPSTVNRRLKRTLRDFHDFIRSMIDTRRDNQSENDLLSILLSARDEETGAAMPEHDVVEEILGMIIGGHETSSSALTWTFWELARHPEILEKVASEIDRAVRDRPIDVEDIPKLIFTRMVLEESLRLHPPFWFENRNVKNDVEMGGVVIPKDSMVLFSRYSLHRHKDFWDAPEQFNPHRHHPDAPENTRSSYAMVSFGGGPRICLGIHFAMQELILVLAMVVQRFNFSIAPDDRHEMIAHMTMTPKYGLRVLLKSK